ncbi:Esterase, partial [Termitomyces sp. T112]
MYRYRHQPSKAIYLTGQFLVTLLRIPLWILVSIPRSWRPRKSWSFKRAFLLKVARFVMVLPSETGPLIKSPNHEAITLGPGINGLWVEPVPDLITGKLSVWKDDNSVMPVRIPGYWTHKK